METNHSVIALVERGGRVLVCWNRHYKGWTLPGGKIEDGEDRETALRRELREELGAELISAPTWFFSAPSASFSRPRRSLGIIGKCSKRKRRGDERL